MLFHIKLVLHILLMPPASLLLLAGVGLYLAGRRPRLGRALASVAVALLFLLSTPIVGNALERHVQVEPPLDLSRPPPAEAVVVLAGGARPYAIEYGGAPALTPISLARLAHGAYLARALGLPILVTGSFSEAKAMQDSLRRDFGTDARWVDDDSTDTYDNAQHSARLLGAAGLSRIVLVTDANHAHRAVNEFRAAGLTVFPGPTDYTPSRSQMRLRLLFGVLPSIEGLDRSERALREIVGEFVRPVLAHVHGLVDPRPRRASSVTRTIAP